MFKAFISLTFFLGGGGEFLAGWKATSEERSMEIFLGSSVELNGDKGCRVEEEGRDV